MLTLWYREKLGDTWPVTYEIYKGLCLSEWWKELENKMNQIDVLRDHVEPYAHIIDTQKRAAEENEREILLADLGLAAFIDAHVISRMMIGTRASRLFIVGVRNWINACKAKAYFDVGLQEDPLNQAHMLRINSENGDYGPIVGGVGSLYLLGHRGQLNARRKYATITTPFEGRHKFAWIVEFY